MAVLTTYADTRGADLTATQELGNQAWIIERFSELFGGVVEPPTQAPTVDASTGQFTAPSGSTYLVSYE